MNHALERAGILFMGSSIRLGEEVVIGCLADSDPERLGRAVAQNLNRDGLTRLGLCHRELQLTSVKHLLAVEPRNHISDLEPGLLGRSVRRNPAHQRTGEHCGA